MKLRMLIALMPFFLFAQSKGTISGTVVDANNSESLVGVNIIVKGTYYGAASDLKGRFFITGVSAGTYDI